MKPILFNTDMVRAILDGRKTVTRRVVKPQPRAIYYDGRVYDDDGLYVVAENKNGGVEQIELPHRPGDILYVRETWNYGYCDTTDFEFQYNETFFEELKPGSMKDSFLWPEMLRVIQEIRLAWVVGENVAGIINMALDTVLSDLESQGYETRAFVFPACAVDAPHRRDRTAIVAHANSGGCVHRELEIKSAETGEYAQRFPVGCGEDVAHAESNRLQGERPAWEQERGTRFETWQLERCSHVPDAHNRGGAMRRDRELPAVESAGVGGGYHPGGTPEHGGGEWWPDEPDVGRVAYGVPSRVDRLKCLGNAVVPQQFYPVFKSIREVAQIYEL